MIGPEGTLLANNPWLLRGKPLLLAHIIYPLSFWSCAMCQWGNLIK